MNITPQRRKSRLVALSTVLTALLIGGAGVTTAQAISSAPLTPATPHTSAIQLSIDDDEEEWPTPMKKQESCYYGFQQDPYLYGFKAVGSDMWVSVNCTTYYDMTRHARQFSNNGGYEFKREARETSTLAPPPAFPRYSLPVDDEEDFWLGTPSLQPFPTVKPAPRFGPLFSYFPEEDDEIATVYESLIPSDDEIQALLDTELADCATTDCLPASRLDDAIREGAVSDDPSQWDESFALIGADEEEDEYVFKKPHKNKKLWVAGCFENLPDDFDGAWGYNPTTNTCITTFDDEESDVAHGTDSSAPLATIAPLSRFLTTPELATVGTVSVLFGDEVITTAPVAANGQFLIEVPESDAGIHTYTMVYSHHADPEAYDYLDFTVLAADHDGDLHPTDDSVVAAADSPDTAELTNNPTLLITLGVLFGVAVIVVIVMLTRRRV